MAVVADTVMMKMKAIKDILDLKKDDILLSYRNVNVERHQIDDLAEEIMKWGYKSSSLDEKILVGLSAKQGIIIKNNQKGDNTSCVLVERKEGGIELLVTKNGLPSMLFATSLIIAPNAKFNLRSSSPNQKISIRQIKASGETRHEDIELETPAIKVKHSN